MMKNTIMQTANALRSYSQADMEGIQVKVSRQACDEGAHLIEEMNGLLLRFYNLSTDAAGEPEYESLWLDVDRLMGSE